MAKSSAIRIFHVVFANSIFIIFARDLKIFLAKWKSLNIVRFMGKLAPKE
jgi:hypothetical protein